MSLKQTKVYQILFQAVHVSQGFLPCQSWHKTMQHKNNIIITYNTNNQHINILLQ